MRLAYIFIFFISLVCQSQHSTNFSSDIVIIGYEEKRPVKNLAEMWQHKDILKDTIPGVSCEKAYKELLGTKPGDTIIVAVIDSGVHIDHEDLKNQIWTNTKEIPNNYIDDDQNGYIDDIHGWNFLGNKKDENIYYARKEYIRLLAEKKLLTRKGLSITKNEIDSITKEAKKFYREARKVLDNDKKFVSKWRNKYEDVTSKLSDFFPNKNYSIEKLLKIDTVKHKYLKESVDLFYTFLKEDISEEWLKSMEDYNSIVEDFKLNYKYQDRKIISDNINDIDDKNYGNNNVIGNINIDNHGTPVAGLIGASRNNNIGIDGIADKVKLMILRAVPKGDEYDKDIALAILYAVDNGAKVINMSFGKFFSPKSNMVIEAIKYAAKKDVLLVHAAGNDSKNIDNRNFYPIDHKNDIEVSQNFIKVGAMTYKLNRKFAAYFSNYGKQNVDVFAPGYMLYTTSTNNKYEVTNGTSFAAPIISGIAAMIRSRYPSLRASQVKEIIMESGNSYSMQVTIPGKKDSPKVPFAELSKSGKVANLYNALLMAEQVSSKKN